MKKSIRLILFGVLIWIIPFVISFAFYDSAGKLTTSYDLFKSTMRIVSSLIGCYFLYRHFLPIREQFMKEGIVAGLVWLVINLILDVVVLVPMAKMEMNDYFVAIGLGYLQIPIICFMAGWILEQKSTANS